MKLLICVSEYYPHGSGIANVAYNVVKQFKKMGIDCKVCSPSGPDIKIGSKKLIEKAGIIGLLYYWYKVAKYFNNKDYDIVWAHHPLFLRKIPFNKLLITMHTTYKGMLLQKLNPKIYYKISSKLESYCLNRISIISNFTAVSPQVCTELEAMGIKRQKIKYIPNGVDVEAYKPISQKHKKKIREKFGIPKDDIVLISLGRLTEMKQPKKLLELLLIINSVMKNITLVIAGKGKMLDETKQFAFEKKIPNVNFLGYVEECCKPDLFSCSDYYIITSRYEGQPLTLLEAMASGLPCIVSNIPNLKIVNDAKCGITIEFNDIRKSSNYIIQYLRKDNSYHSKNARYYSEKKLDWKIITQRYLKEFKMLSKN